MSEDFIINAEDRTVQGKGASRRLRREGKVPVILYGGHKEPRMLQTGHNELLHHLEHEAFYSHILTVKIGKDDEMAVLKDVQRHPSKLQINHVDLLRVVKGEKLRMSVPLHFVGEDVAPGVKLRGGVFQHLMTELDISVLPKDLPEYIEVNVSELDVDESVHLADITLPKGVEVAAHLLEENPTLVSIHIPRAVVEEVEEPEEGEEGEEAAAGDETAADDAEEKKEEGGEE